MSAQPSITLAEQLLALTKAISQTENTDNFQDVIYNRNRIVALCDELKRCTIGPSEYTVLLAESCQESSALRFISELGVADIIADETASLSEISRKTGVNIRYLQITMNCLVAHGYFEEVGGFGTGLLRNNSLSKVLRSGHDESLKEAVGFICDEGFKSTSYLLEAATSGAKSENNGKYGTKKTEVSAASTAFGFHGSIFEWMASPEQAYRGQRMGKAMQQLHRMANGSVITDFAWEELACPIVDIGGGVGSLEMALLKVNPATALTFVIFDIAETIQNAKKLWSAEMSEDAQAHISFVSGDFLEASLAVSNIPKGQPTYLIRHVLHDWTDEHVVIILQNIRQAMLVLQSERNTPKLLVCEMLLRETSPRFVRTTSMQILALNNGMTRTEKDMIRLLDEAGFTVIKVHSMRSVDSIIEVVPT